MGIVSAEWSREYSVLMKRPLTKNMLVARAGHPDAPTREYSVLKKSLMKNMLVAQAVCNAHVEKAAGTSRMLVTPANVCCNALASSHGARWTPHRPDSF